MIRARTTSGEATQALAAAMAELLRSGDIVVLAGEMGAGKTAFTQGLGVGLGVAERITSPTFTIAQEYQGRLTLHHLDVYRLDHLNEALDVGLGEIIEEDGVVVIEWGDAVAPLLPRNYLQVRITFGDDDDHRHLELHAVGAPWQARQRLLAERVAPWLPPADADEPSGGGAC